MIKRQLIVRICQALSRLHTFLSYCRDAALIKGKSRKIDAPRAGAVATHPENISIQQAERGGNSRALPWDSRRKFNLSKSSPGHSILQP